jgi:hypothetical protein
VAGRSGFLKKLSTDPLNPAIVESNSYSGVLCVRCGDPIPVSARVIRLQDEIEQGETNVPYTFLVRCRLVAQSESDTCGKMAVRVRKDAENWIQKNYPDKLG